MSDARGRGMNHDPIHGRGHKTLKVGNPSIFHKLSPPPFTIGAGN